MCTRMPHSQADESAFRQWIRIRGTFTSQVRQEKQPFTTRGYLPGHLCKFAEIFFWCECIPEPPVTARCREHHSHKVPLSWHGMAEGMQPPVWLDQWRIGGSKDHPGGAQGQ